MPAIFKFDLPSSPPSRRWRTSSWRCTARSLGRAPSRSRRKPPLAPAAAAHLNWRTTAAAGASPMPTPAPTTPAGSCAQVGRQQLEGRREHTLACALSPKGRQAPSPRQTFSLHLSPAASRGSCCRGAGPQHFQYAHFTIFGLCGLCNRHARPPLPPPPQCMRWRRGQPASPQGAQLCGMGAMGRQGEQPLLGRRLLTSRQLHSCLKLSTSRPRRHSSSGAMLSLLWTCRCQAPPQQQPRRRTGRMR